MFGKYFDESKVRYTCSLCGEPIYVGDDYYEIHGDAICEVCIDDSKKFAEDIDEEDYF